MEAPAAQAQARVLLVEDDEEVASAVRRYLSEEGFTVTVATDAHWALEILSAVDYRVDAILLDLLLPGMSGREACRRLRAAGHWVPVLMVTALGEVADRVLGFQDGADDYLVKPFSLHELAMRLRAILRRATASAAGLLETGDLRLEVATRRCWRGDSELKLSPREFEILYFFMQRPGLVISRSSIVAGVWGEDAAVSPNAVDQYVGHLRRKIGGPGGQAQLETLHRLGYRLRAPWPG